MIPAERRQTFDGTSCAIESQSRCAPLGATQVGIQHHSCSDPFASEARSVALEQLEDRSHGVERGEGPRPEQELQLREADGAESP